VFPSIPGLRRKGIVSASGVAVEFRRPTIPLLDRILNPIVNITARLFPWMIPQWKSFRGSRFNADFAFSGRRSPLSSPRFPPNGRDFTSALLRGERLAFSVSLMGSPLFFSS